MTYVTLPGGRLARIGLKPKYRMTGFKRRERLTMAFEAAGLPLPVPKEVLEAVRACELRAIRLRFYAAGGGSPGIHEGDLELDEAEIEQLKAEFFDREPHTDGHSGDGAGEA